MPKGIFVTFEGGEGGGKSTQIVRLATKLKAKGFSVVMLREPGGTKIGEGVRGILLNPKHDNMNPIAELLLFEAARSQNISENVRPLLEQGTVVLMDRFYDSTSVYQGYARGVDLETIRGLNVLASGGISPNRTFVLDLPVSVGLTRATRSGADRLEAEDVSFHEKVRAGFLTEAKLNPERFRVIDASGTEEQVEALVWDNFLDLLEGI